MIGKTERKKDYRETKTVYVNYLTYSSQEIPQPQDFPERRPGLASLGRQSYPNRGGQAGRASKRL